MRKIKNAALYLLIIFGASDAAHALTLNGIGVYEQDFSELYLAALYVGWTSDDAPAIASMPGRKHIDLHVATARWPRAQFQKHWNHLIAANNNSADLNDNALDVMDFFESIKGDLIKGDKLIIELDGNNTTRIFLNDALLKQTDGSGLFFAILKSCIGPRPPSDDFKNGLLRFAPDTVNEQLYARLIGLKPTAQRSREVALWQSQKRGASFNDNINASANTAAVALAAQPAAITDKTLPVAAMTAAPSVIAHAPSNPAPTQPARSSVITASQEVAYIPAPASTPKPATPAKPLLAKESSKESTQQNLKRNPPEKLAIATSEAPDQSLPQQSLQPQLEAAPLVDARQQQLRDEYQRFVRTRIKQNTLYPKRAVHDGIEGLVLVNMTLDRNGAITYLAVADSGQQILDAAAERAARRAAPFPPPATELDGGDLTMKIPIVFKLEN